MLAILAPHDQPLHHTISRTLAVAAFPNVIGGPGIAFISSDRYLLNTLAAITAKKAGFRSLADTAEEARGDQAPRPWRRKRARDRLQLQRQPQHDFTAHRLDFVSVRTKQRRGWHSISARQADVESKAKCVPALFLLPERREHFRSTLQRFP
jgi:hypothetical protein